MNYDEILKLVNDNTMTINDIIKIIRNDHKVFPRAISKMGWKYIRDIDSLGGSFLLWNGIFINFRWYKEERKYTNNIFEADFSSNTIKVSHYLIYSIEMNIKCRNISDKTLKYIMLHELGHIMCKEYRRVNPMDKNFLSDSDDPLNEEIVCDMYAFQLSGLSNIQEVLGINKEIIDFIDKNFDKNDSKYGEHMKSMRENLKYRYNEMKLTLNL